MDAKNELGTRGTGLNPGRNPVTGFAHPAFTLPADSADFRGLVVDHKKGEFGALVEICGILRATASQK